MWVRNNDQPMMLSNTTVSPAGHLSDPLDALDMLPLMITELRDTMESVRRIDRNTETLKNLYAPIAIVGMGAITAAILYNASKKRRS